MLDLLYYQFESSVNSEGIETNHYIEGSNRMFESSVNSEGIETQPSTASHNSMFESSVNSEGIETVKRHYFHH